MDSLINSRLKLLESDRDLGASQLAKEALELLKFFIETTNINSFSELTKEITFLANRIKGIRPSIYPIISRIDRFLKEVDNLVTSDIDNFKFRLIELLNNILLDSSKAKALIKDYTSKLLSSFQTILTHSYSSTLSEVFSSLSKRSIFITESRPLCEGIKLANALNGLGHNVSLITDMQSGHFLSKCDAVVVGADSIFLDGTLINKAGTFVIAVLAKTLSIPFYVVSEVDKIIPRSFVDGNIKLEEKSSDEVFNGKRDFSIRNVYFDITPPLYISEFITEKGVFKPNELKGILYS